MGLKFLRLHMIPWCFHMMGHRISCVQFPRDQKPTGTIKLIKSDGVVKIYKRPIPASQIMLEFPKHMVCSSDSFYIGQKIIPLSSNDKLHLGHSYFLLPTHSFQTVLTFVNLATFASAANSLMSSKVKGNCQPFDITKTPSGCLKIRVSEEFISQLIVEKVSDDDGTDEDENGNDNDKREIQAYKGKGKRKWKNKREVVCKNSKNRVCTTAQLKKDYTQMVGSKREWKPKLEMIRERGEKKRKLSSFGMKRIKKKSQILVGTHKNRHHHHASSSTSSTSLTSSSYSSSKSQCKNKVKKFA